MTKMKRTILLPSIAFLAASLASAAHAEIPPFTAECPTGVTVTWDAAGIVRVNGTTASVRMYNPNYFEATAGGITFPISTEDDGSHLLVGFNPPGSAGGYCTIVSQGSASAPPPPSSGEVTHFEVVANGRLNLRSGPSTSTTIVGHLPSRAVVENLGCVEAEGRSWCRVTDGRSAGWAAAEFLGQASGPVQLPRAMPVTQGDPSSFTVQQVRFPRGTSGTEFTDSLDPQVSHRYLLGARSGQFLYFRLAANGPGMTYVIYNPDGSVLLDETSADREYRGQLWQTGDHIVEVYNTSNGRQSFNVIFGID